MTSQNQVVGQLERKTQDRVVALFRDRLRYDYLGNWEDNESNSNIVDVYIRRLRTKLEVDAEKPRHIISVRGLGYKFLAK